MAGRPVQPASSACRNIRSHESNPSSWRREGRRSNSGYPNDIPFCRVRHIEPYPGESGIQSELRPEIPADVPESLDLDSDESVKSAPSTIDLIWSRVRVSCV